MVIRANGTLDVSLLNSLTINTYLNNKSTPEESFPLNTLVSLSVVNSGVTEVRFPAGKTFNHVELSAAGQLSASVQVDLFAAYGTLTSPLPVELAAFRGQAIAGGAVRLSWETALESNSHHFVVERAGLTASDFRGIGQLAAAGASTQRRQYQFADIAAQGLCYYRLRQVDQDGKETFSPVVAVRARAAEGPLAVYPNPAIDVLHLEVPVSNQLVVLNQLGRVLRRTTVAGPVQGVAVSDLPDGTYFLRDEATGQTVRFTKQAGR